MKYIYMPDSFDYDLIKHNFQTEEDFIKTAILYKKGLERMLNEIIDFDRINEYIEKSNIQIPEIQDQEYNFYHKFSFLNSRHLFLRNNIHTEKLSTEELAELKTDKSLTEQFLMDTLSSVIFEEGDKTFVGLPSDTTLVDSKSIIIEFAYDQKLCTSIEQLQGIRTVIDQVYGFLQEDFSKAGLPLSFNVYDAVPDIYAKEDDLDPNLKLL